MAILADVARRAGVSTTTASRVLNNKMVMPISQATIERIHEAARELNYRPNSLARALATGRNQVLGLYSVVMTHPQFTQMLEAVERRARELGFTLDEVRALLGLANGGESRCADVRDLAASHLKDVRERIADLERMERVLADSVRACDAGLEPGCPLLDALGAGSRDAEAA